MKNHERNKPRHNTVNCNRHDWEVRTNCIEVHRHAGTCRHHNQRLQLQQQRKGNYTPRERFSDTDFYPDCRFTHLLGYLHSIQIGATIMPL